MPARLFCKTGELAGSAFNISHEATIGRLSENEITLFPNVISGKHARIFFNEDEKSFFIEDLGSSNGTSLDGIEVDGPMRLEGLNVITFANELDFIFLSGEHLPSLTTGTVSTPVQSAPQKQAPAASSSPYAAPAADDPGEETRIGGFDAMPSFKQETPADDPLDKTLMGGDFGAMPSFKDPPPSGTDTPAEDLDKTLYGDPFGMTPPGQAPAQESARASGPSPYSLSVVFEGGRKQNFTLKEGRNTIGRTEASDLHFPDNSISRNHAVLLVQTGRVLLEDKGSKNGTYINRQKVSSQTEVQPGTTIQFGHQIQATLNRL